ncbi:hypothetical protein K443DRAFT_677390 [Laccaria amethystina LaAM-08-1]|uniref:Peptidase A1 domain-containing protein n=1 Tax=Laccaria amethystina LaAM-08-1 TaxID=1095629 RepID=A0A0C9XCP1_9AGAR|nr:hypothetical protein K443DRAFT_677390 [Laccaria amethystina LaAM-08-1]
MTNVILFDRPQLFKVVLGTGSADLLVADICASCNSSMTPLFDPSRSLTFNSTLANTTISYGSGTVGGIIAQDVVTMGSFTVQNQTFLAANQFPAGFLAGSASGIMGLAFSALSTTRSTPFWQALGSQLAAPEMAFYLTRFNNDSSAQQEEPGGVFTLGGVDSTLFTGDIEFLAMSPGTPIFWLLNMSAITVQGQSVQITTGNAALAVFDTGTTLIGGPTADVKAIWAAVPGSAVVNGTEYFSFPCSTSVQVTLSFGGKAWPINVTDMNLGPVSQGSSQCLGAIFDANISFGNPSWTLGDTFLKNVYSVFRANPPSIGFAQLSSVASESGRPNANDSSATTNDSGPYGSRNGGSSTRITLPAMITTAMIVVLMCLL